MTDDKTGAGLANSTADESPVTDSAPDSIDITVTDSEETGSDGATASRKTLTIGMATYDDYDGVYFTLQSLRLHHPEVQDRIEYLIIDNNPGSNDGEACKKITELTGRDGGSPRSRYLSYDSVQGTAAARNELFRQARTPFVMCVDCHVLFGPGSINRLLDYIDANPESDDLLQGAMIYDDLRPDNVSTHFAPTFEDGSPRWSAGMLGQWATDERGRDPDAEPFEIPMQGLGVFAMRKDAWPGFNRHFRSFGGEEGYIHEKVRRLGGKTLCLPFLRWLHRFDRPTGVPYSMVRADRIRNYVIGHRENGLDETPIRDHFLTLMDQETLDQILDDLKDFDPLS